MAYIDRSAVPPALENQPMGMFRGGFASAFHGLPAEIAAPASRPLSVFFRDCNVYPAICNVYFEFAALLAMVGSLPG
jgi:hypothetical protein